jgi:hypothetical protein
MKSNRFFIPLIAFILPIVFTGLWFYSGFPKTNTAAMPDFAVIDLSQAPLSTAVALPNAPEANSSSVLIDLKHGNLLSLSEIDPLVRNIESMGGAIDVFKDDADLGTSLKSSSAFICAVPMNAFTKEELQSVIAFVERGGRLVVITDPTRNTFFSESGTAGLSGVDAANLLLEPFNLSFRDDYLYNLVNNEANYRNIILTAMSKHILMKDIQKLVIYGGHSLNSNGTPLVNTDSDTKSSGDERIGDLTPMEITNFGEGQVLAIGDISILTSQYVQSGDNQIFVRNLAGFLTDTSRQKTLAEFPFIFKRGVVVQPTGDIKVDGEMLSALSTLEKSLATKPGALTISEEPVKNSDRILLTTFSSNKNTEDILELLKIDLSPALPIPENTAEKTAATPTPEATLTPTELPDQAEMDISSIDAEIPSDNPENISLPGLGIVKTSGLGVIGLLNENNTTTLVLMASSPEKLQELIKQISSDNLTNCLIHENLAACRISATDAEPVG